MTDQPLESIDAAIVGGGVVGLAAACAVAARGRTTCVIERRPRPGLEASTHNSGVVHAGIYYPRDSLKAALCVEGRERLYAFCAEQRVPCERCGKLIVASRTAELADARSARHARPRQRGHRPRGRRSRFRPPARAARRRGGGHLVAVDRGRRGGSVRPRAGAGGRRARRGAAARCGRRRRNRPPRRDRGPDRSGDDPRPHRGQRRGPLRRRRLDRARRRKLHDLPGPRRLRGARAGGQASGQRPGLSVAGPERARARGAPDPDHVGQRDAGPDRPLSVPQGRLRVGPRASGPVPRRGQAAAARARPGSAPPRRQRHPRPRPPPRSRRSRTS